MLLRPEDSIDGKHTTSPHYLTLRGWTGCATAMIMMECPLCHGTGKHKRPEKRSARCPICAGDGEIEYWFMPMPSPGRNPVRDDCLDYWSVMIDDDGIVREACHDFWEMAQIADELRAREIGEPWHNRWIIAPCLGENWLRTTTSGRIVRIWNDPVPAIVQKELARNPGNEELLNTLRTMTEESLSENMRTLGPLYAWRPTVTNPLPASARSPTKQASRRTPKPTPPKPKHPQSPRDTTAL